MGVPEKVYLEMEEYARANNPQYFLYEVIVMAWETFKKVNSGQDKKSNGKLRTQ